MSASSTSLRYCRRQWSISRRLLAKHRAAKCGGAAEGDTKTKVAGDQPVPTR